MSNNARRLFQTAFITTEQELRSLQKEIKRLQRLQISYNVPHDMLRKCSDDEEKFTLGFNTAKDSFAFNVERLLAEINSILIDCGIAP